MKLLTLLTLSIFVALASAGPEVFMEVTGLISSSFNQETGTFADNARETLLEAHTLITEADMSGEQEVLALNSMNSMVTYNLACLEAINGNNEDAFVWLEESVESGYGDAEWMALDDDLAALRDDARFDGLVEAATENFVEPEEHDCGSCDHSETCN